MRWWLQPSAARKFGVTCHCEPDASTNVTGPVQSDSFQPTPDARIMGLGMRRLIQAGFAGLFISAMLASWAWADEFDDAFAAYRRGDYATALLGFRSVG